MAISKIQELLGLMQKNLECSICLELLKNPVATKCDHYFCRFCIIEFLDKKRSVPCPLCKQPITKRSLKEKQEFQNVVEGVNKLISAFQDDSGTVLSPPKGPQSFFPCTPESIDTKPEKTRPKGKKNVRNTRRSKDNTSAEGIQEMFNLDNVDTDDCFAVPSIAAPRTRRGNTARRSSCLSTSSTEQEPRLETSNPAKASDDVRCGSDEIIEGVLQYLEEGSCGFVDTIPPKASSLGNTFRGQAADGGAILPDSDIEESLDKQQTKNSTSGDVPPNITDIVIKDASQDNEESNTAEMFSEVNNRNTNNTVLEIDKENVISGVKSPPKSKRERGRTGLMARTANTVSPCSPEEFRHRSTAPTTTYTRRSRSGSSEKNNEAWTLIQGNQTGRNTEDLHIGTRPNNDQNSTEKNTTDRVQKDVGHADTETARGLHKGNIPTTEKTNTCDSAKAHEKNQSRQHKDVAVTVETEEEFISTPSVRKKSIFKRKTIDADRSAALTFQQQNESSPPLTDPYNFVVGDTPVAKAKKRGRPRSKDKSKSTNSVKSEVQKKSVQFSDEENMIVQSDDAGKTHDDHNMLNQSKISSVTVPSTKPATIEGAQFDFHSDGTTEIIALRFSNTRSRSRQQKKTPNKIIDGNNPNISEVIKDTSVPEVRKSGTRKNKKTEEEDTNVEEQQTKELASWIGEAEDHDLLFSTQDARASIESMSAEEAENNKSIHEKGDKELQEIDAVDEENGVIRLTEEDDDSNDDYCLVGPSPNNRSFRDSHKCLGKSDFYSVNIQEVACENDGSLDSSVAEKNTEKGKVQDEGNMIVVTKEDLHVAAGVTTKNSNIRNVLISETQDTVKIVPETQSSMLSPTPNITNKVVSPNVQTLGSSSMIPTTAPLKSIPIQKKSVTEHTKLLRDAGGLPTISPITATAKRQQKGATKDMPEEQIFKSVFSSPVHFRRQTRASLSAGSSPVVTVIPSTLMEDSCITSSTKFACSDSENLVDPQQEEVSEQASGELRKTPVSKSSENLSQHECNRKKLEETGNKNNSIKITCIPDTVEISLISADTSQSASNVNSPAGTSLPQRRLSLHSTKSPSSSKSSPSIHLKATSEAADKMKKKVFKMTGQELIGDKAEVILVDNENPLAEKDEVHIEQVLDDNSCHSSSTDDLDIVPSEYDFEEPDLSLQPEDIQQKLSVLEHLLDQSLSDSTLPSTFTRRDTGSPFVSPKLLNPKTAKDKEAAGLKTHSFAVNRIKTSPQMKRNQSHLKENACTNLDQLQENISEAPSSIRVVLDSAVTHVTESVDGEVVSDSSTQPRSGKAESSSSSVEILQNRGQGSSPGSERSCRSLFEHQMDNLKFMQCDKTSVMSLPDGVSNSPVQVSSESSDTPSQSILKPLPVKSCSSHKLAKASTDQHLNVSPSGNLLDVDKNRMPDSPDKYAKVIEEPEKHHKESTQSECSELLNTPQKLFESVVSEKASKTCKGSLDRNSPEVSDEPEKHHDESTQPEYSELLSIEQQIFESVEQEKATKMSKGSLDRNQNDEQDEASDSPSLLVGSLSLTEDVDRSKVLVCETQPTPRNEKQSVSLLSPRVIMDSNPDEETIGGVGQARSLLKTQTSSQAAHSARTPACDEIQTSICAVTETSLQFEKVQEEKAQSTSKHQQEVSQDALPKKGKRKLDLGEENDENEITSKPPKKLANDDSFFTPELQPKAPSFVTPNRKVRSAPARTKSFIADSDGDDDVLVIKRRTKRKCFSLGGSPLKASPLATKRRKYSTRLISLPEKVDYEDNTVKNKTEGVSVDDGNDRAAEDARKSVVQIAESLKENEKGVEIIEEHIPEITAARDISSKELEKSKSNDSNCERERASESSTTPDICPLSRRKKTARGLARLNPAMSAFVESEQQKDEEIHELPKNSPFNIPITVEASSSTKNSKETATNHSADLLVSPKERLSSHDIGADVNVCMWQDNNRKHFQMHVDISEDELMEVEDVDEAADSEILRELEFEHTNFPMPNKGENLQAAQLDDNEEHEHVHSSPRHKMDGEIQQAKEAPPDVHEMQTGIHSQIEKSNSPTQVSVRSCTEDATIPPPSFDLRLDDSESEDGALSQKSSSVPEQLAKQPESQTVVKDSRRNQESPSSTRKSIGHTASSEAGDSDACTSTKSAGEKRQSFSTSPKSRSLVTKGDDSEEEEEVIRKKRNRNAVIDSDDDSDHNSGAESEASFQLNFTSSSAVSTQSDILTTQERSKMESELERLRREIAETEAKLRQAGRSTSSKSDSPEDNKDTNHLNNADTSYKRHTVSATSFRPSLTLDSNDSDEDDSSSGTRRRKSSRLQAKQSSQARQLSKLKRQKRRTVISSDEEDDVEEYNRKGNCSGQQLMDAFVYEVKDDDSDDDDVREKHPGHGIRSQHTPPKKSKDRDGDNLMLSGEESSDLFLSPLSPSPPPKSKYTLANKASHILSKSVFDLNDSPDPSWGHSFTKVRQSLDFKISKPRDSSRDIEKEAHAEKDFSRYDDIKDSQDNSPESVRQIPESQFLVSGRETHREESSDRAPSPSFHASPCKVKSFSRSYYDAGTSPEKSRLQGKNFTNKMVSTPSPSKDDASLSGGSLPNLSPMKSLPPSANPPDSPDGAAEEENQTARDICQEQCAEAEEYDKDPQEPASPRCIGAAEVNNRMEEARTDFKNAGILEDDDDKEITEDELPRWKRSKFGFISSGLDAEKMAQLRELAEMHECKVYSKFNQSVTHVIMRTYTGERACDRTLKYFQGIAGRCWVLSHDWVVDSLREGRYVPEDDYEIKGDTVKGANHIGPRLARLSDLPLLEGFAFAPLGVSPDMSKKELIQLLQLSGAEVLEDMWDLASYEVSKHKLVLRCVDSDTQPPTPAEIELFNGHYKHLGLVTIAREWILDSICTHRLQPLKEYVFNTNKNIKLPL